MRARIALLLLAALLAAAPAHAFDLDELMRLLGARTEASATFTEQQHLAALDRPLRSSGELSWRAPDDRMGWLRIGTATSGWLRQRCARSCV